MSAKEEKPVTATVDETPKVAREWCSWGEDHTKWEPGVIIDDDAGNISRITGKWCSWGEDHTKWEPAIFIGD